jgi:hypothetical protein
VQKDGAMERLEACTNSARVLFRTPCRVQEWASSGALRRSAFLASQRPSVSEWTIGRVRRRSLADSVCEIVCLRVREAIITQRVSDSPFGQTAPRTAASCDLMGRGCPLFRPTARTPLPATPRHSVYCAFPHVNCPVRPATSNQNHNSSLQRRTTLLRRPTSAGHLPRPAVCSLRECILQCGALPAVA